MGRHVSVKSCTCYVILTECLFILRMNTLVMCHLLLAPKCRFVSLEVLPVLRYFGTYVNGGDRKNNESVVKCKVTKDGTITF